VSARGSGSDRENLARLAALLKRWEATNPDGTPLRTATLTAGGTMALRTRHCFVDILSAQLLPAPFHAVLARSEVKRIDGVEAPICSLADLVAMKRAAGRSTDQLDLERLSDAHGALPGVRPASADAACRDEVALGLGGVRAGGGFQACGTQVRPARASRG